jgi:hypothetical protein
VPFFQCPHRLLELRAELLQVTGGALRPKPTPQLRKNCTLDGGSADPPPSLRARNGLMFILREHGWNCHCCRSLTRQWREDVYTATPLVRIRVTFMTGRSLSSARTARAGLS